MVAPSPTPASANRSSSTSCLEGAPEGAMYTSRIISAGMASAHSAASVASLVVAPPFKRSEFWRPVRVFSVTPSAAVSAVRQRGHVGSLVCMYISRIFHLARHRRCIRGVSEAFPHTTQPGSASRSFMVQQCRAVAGSSTTAAVPMHIPQDHSATVVGMGASPGSGPACTAQSMPAAQSNAAVA